MPNNSNQSVPLIKDKKSTMLPKKIYFLTKFFGIGQKKQRKQTNQNARKAQINHV